MKLFVFEEIVVRADQVEGAYVETRHTVPYGDWPSAYYTDRYVVVVTTTGNRYYDGPYEKAESVRKAWKRCKALIEQL